MKIFDRKIKDSVCDRFRKELEKLFKRNFKKVSISNGMKSFGGIGDHISIRDDNYSHSISFWLTGTIGNCGGAYMSSLSFPYGITTQKKKEFMQVLNRFLDECLALDRKYGIYYSATQNQTELRSLLKIGGWNEHKEVWLNKRYGDNCKIYTLVYQKK